MQTSGTQHLNVARRLHTLRQTLNRHSGTVLVQKSRIPASWHPNQTVSDTVKGHCGHRTVVGRVLGVWKRRCSSGEICGPWYRDSRCLRRQWIMIADVRSGVGTEEVQPDRPVVSTTTQLTVKCHLHVNQIYASSTSSSSNIIIIQHHQHHHHPTSSASSNIISIIIIIHQQHHHHPSHQKYQQNYTVSQKKRSIFVFVRTLSNFHQF